MASIPAVELEHCRELALIPGSVFEFTSRFLPAGKLEPTLALYAFWQAVSSIPGIRADDSVKWAKLKWWGEELTADASAPSRHPVLRALWQSGAREKLGDHLLLRLVSDTLSQIDVAPDSDEDAMFERLGETGSTEILLELAMEDAEIDNLNLKLLGAASGSFRLISNFAVNRRPETAQLPLSMLAKHNVSISELEQNTHVAELAKIIAQLAGRSLDWFSQGMSGLSIRPDSSFCAHLQLRWAMERRRLYAIRRDAAGFVESGSRYGPADAWFAWRFLRKLK
ncbi:MAG: squalene/phytoene synthase family protein [Lysobacterales bacterium]